MSCSQGKLGVQLQNEALELTGAIAPKFVPTIVYNNVSYLKMLKHLKNVNLIFYNFIDF